MHWGKTFEKCLQMTDTKLISVENRTDKQYGARFLKKLQSPQLYNSRLSGAPQKTRFNLYSVDETSTLCRLESEDLSHLILALAEVGDSSLTDIKEFVASQLGQFGHCGQKMIWLRG